MAKKKSSKPKVNAPKKLKDDQMVTVRKDKLSMFQKLVRAKARRSDSHHDPNDPPTGDGDVNA